MVLVDAGPWVALFDPSDAAHQRCRTALEKLSEPLATTVPVLTEALYLLRNSSRGAGALRDFIVRGRSVLWFFDDDAVVRAFELMETYGDKPMDFADASLITAAERLETRRFFTLDRRDFDAYRIRRGHRYYPPELLLT